jgi:hypothetical protein
MSVELAGPEIPVRPEAGPGVFALLTSFFSVRVHVRFELRNSVFDVRSAVPGADARNAPREPEHEPRRENQEV